MKILVEALRGTPVSEQRSEIVERKGLGHPDTICDLVMEQASLALSREYRSRFGVILHHNLDKALLIGGAVERQFGGGTVVEPMRLFFGDRATFQADNQTIPVQDIVIETAREWFRNNFRFVNPYDDVQYQFEVRPGSEELRDLFVRSKGRQGSNDTSAAVGYAPLTQTESIVLETEMHLNSQQFKQLHPESGEDVKIMAYRIDRDLKITVAMPLLDRFIEDESDYFASKKKLGTLILDFIHQKASKFRKIDLVFNALDKRKRGMGGMYLSVLGTSAGDADSGEVGRGNRVNGLISLNRPSSIEAAAGKNSVSHVGKIYNVLAHKMAHEIYQNIEGIQEVYVFLGSQIGAPISDPSIAAAKVILTRGTSLRLIGRKIQSRMEKDLSEIKKFCEELQEGKYPVA